MRTRQLIAFTAIAWLAPVLPGLAAVAAPVLKWSYGGCIAGPYCQTGWYSSPAVADLDGDGQPEVVWGAYDVVSLNGATGALKWRGMNGQRVWPGVVIADLTGDGTLEVVGRRRASASWATCTSSARRGFSCTVCRCPPPRSGGP